MNLDSNAATLAVIAALTPLLNILVSLAKQYAWPKQVTQLVAIGLSLAGGAGVTYLAGGFSNLPQPVNWLSVAGILFTATQTFYAVAFKDSPLDAALSNVGVAPQHKLMAAITHYEAVPGFHDVGRPSEAGPLTAVLDTRPFDVPAPPPVPSTALLSS